MGDLSVLASLRWVEIRNRIRIYRRAGRFKTLVIAFFSVAFWVGLYQVFFQALGFLKTGIGFAAVQEDMIQAMFHVFFLALTLMLIFSNAIIGYGAYFRSKETGFLLSTPVRPESIYLHKFSECLAFSSWAFLFLGTPLMAAYAAAFGQSVWFFLLTIPYFVAFLFIPAAIGAIVAMLVTVYVPRTRKSLMAAVIVAGCVVLLIVIAKLLAFRGSYFRDLMLVRQVFQSPGVGFSRNPLLPSSWVAQGILRLAAGRAESAAFFFGLIASNALFLCMIAHSMAARLLRRGWFVTQGLRKTKKYRTRGIIDFFFGRLLFFVSRPVRLIVIKDVKSFVRDPVQWSQFLIFFGLLGIYFLNLRTFAYEERSVSWKNLIAQMNLLATALTLATFASRFIYPQLSLEGRRFWVIGMMPITREKILLGKLALSFTTALLISELLIAVSSYMLATPLTLTVLHMVTLFGICLGISGLAVGLGALYPSFGEESPSKIVSGFGGTLNLVITLLFVLAVLSLQAIPCFLNYSSQWTLRPGQFRMWIVLAMIGIAALSLVACLVPMALGMRALRKMEV
ncbi:MAG: putative ABC transporter permease subunit [Planctomycetota bacterium]|jgi:ABC-2 type transport system permease protein